MSRIRTPLSATLVLIILIGCQDAPTEPRVPAQGSFAQTGEADSREFYYYDGRPIYLEIDPEHLIVSSHDRATVAIAEQALAGIGVSVSGAKSLSQAPEHYLLTLQGASANVSRQAASLLRADPRFSFASPAFRTVDGRHDVLLLNRVDVQFKSSVTITQIDSLNQSLGTRIVRPPRPDSGFYAYRMTYPTGVEPLSVAQTLYHSPLVRWADPDKITDIRPDYVPLDPYYGLQFHLKNSTTLNGVPVDIDVERAWDLTRGNGTIRVAIIDDGVDILHGNSGGGYSGDLTGVFGGAAFYDLLYNPNRDEHADKPCCNDTHGTSIAGIIAGTQDNGTGGAGISPNVILNAVRIYRQVYPPFGPADLESASTGQIGDGINVAWQAMSSDVISNSWGGGSPSDAITNAIQSALQSGRGGKGTVVVFSAGNTADRRVGNHGSVHYPALLSASSNVISVGAINRSGGPANYTPDGPVDIVAPSGNDTGACFGEIVTTDRYGAPGCNDGPSGDANYTATFSGTSATAPQVSGVVALLLSREPALTAAQVKARIRGSADFWGSSSTYGAGKLNAYRALASAPTQLSVSISGPTEIRPGATCTWEGNVSGGTAPYTYEWTNEGNYGGNASTYTGSKDPGSTNNWFHVRVVVNDLATGSGQSEIIVTESSNAPLCPN